MQAQGLTNEEDMLRDLRLRATQGNSDSQCTLATLLLRHVSKPLRDPIEAAKWLHLSAEQDHPEAPYWLYRLYQSGLGVPKDDAKALHWLIKAAENGQQMAQFDLSFRYSKGDGVPANEQEALRWLTLAAENLHVEAAYQLACRYENGQGLPEDQAEAFKWFHEAASGGHGPARYRLSQAYEVGDGVPQNSRRAVWSLMEAAESGMPEAQCKIGLYYLKGHMDLVNQDNERALRWLLLCALSRPHDSLVQEYATKAGATLTAGQHESARSWAIGHHHQIELQKKIQMPPDLN